MKKYLHTIILLLVFSFSQAQTKINQNLKMELDSILKSDQILREYIDSETTKNRKTEILKETGYSKDGFLNNIWGIINKQDSINLVKIEKIIGKYGYPGKTLVGVPTNEAAWFVIQHSSKIKKYFPLIEKAGLDNEIDFTKVAMMQDRLLTSQGEEQIYGTQGAGKNVINKETGKEEYFRYILPIKDPKMVNERRKNAGFTSTVEENAKRMEIEYKVYTLVEINNL
ncbi:MAG: hypothetical protein C0412_12615 [Flavobacterium sp.]|nr:hypothetical protein [Flavobacterium sp.]